MKSTAKLKLVISRSGPSRSFIELTRNIEQAENAPWRFEPTLKGKDDVVI